MIFISPILFTKILTYISTIKSPHTCLSLYSKTEKSSSLTVYFSLGLQNLISALFSFLDCSFTGLTNFWVPSCFEIPYSSSFTACQEPALLSTPISIPRNKAKRRARNKSTFIATEHVQNVIKRKENFLNNLFRCLSNFFHFSLGYCQIHLRILSKLLKTYTNDVCHFPWTINDCPIFLFSWHLIIPDQNELVFSPLWRQPIFKPKNFCY